MNDAARRLQDQAQALRDGGTLLVPDEPCEFDAPLAVPTALTGARLRPAGPRSLLRFVLTDPRHQTAIELASGEDMAAVGWRIEGLTVECLFERVPYCCAIAARAMRGGRMLRAVVQGCRVTLDAPSGDTAYGIHLVTSLVELSEQQVVGGAIDRNLVVVRRGKVRAIQVTGGQRVLVSRNRVVDGGEPVGDRKGVSLIGASDCVVIRNQVWACDSPCHWTGLRVNGAERADGTWMPAEHNDAVDNTLYVDDVGVLADREARGLTLRGNVTSAKVPLEVRAGAEDVGQWE